MSDIFNRDGAFSIELGTDKRATTWGQVCNHTFVVVRDATLLFQPFRAA